MADKELEELTNKLAQTKVDIVNELSFKGRGLKLNKKEDAKEIVEEIEKFQNLTALRLEGNTVGVEAAEAIAGALAKHPEFSRARWSDMFTGRLKTEIPAALKHLGAAIIRAGAGLVELDLSDNAFGPTGVDGLVELLKSKSAYALKELRLNNNGLGIGGGKMLAQCLLDCHKSSTEAGTPLALKTFISGRNRLENDGAQALAKAFKAIGTLEEIAMPQNGINPPGISALAEAFENNPKLRILNLNDNTFTEKGADIMAKVLVKLTNLEVINFGDCLIRTRGAKAIAEALAPGHEKLRELILSGNEIRKDGASAVAESVENKAHLTLLDLDANQLGEEGIELVRGTLETINKLDVLGSLSGDEGSDDEDEDEDDEEDVTQDGSEEKDLQDDDEEGEVINDPGFIIQGKGISPSKQASTASTTLDIADEMNNLKLS
ncbi:hypothetical protein ACJMK2_032441 [Sinanodonta woodiana]|uniref:Ran GTPase activating protein 1 n=1 Tax=Sinanodonta woodiana TaxID=1069815 RepID=A0ABD3X591_SINWO